MLGMWDVPDVGPWGCGMFGCAMFRMWYVEDVGCLPGCGMLIYKMHKKIYLRENAQS